MTSKLIILAIFCCSISAIKASRGPQYTRDSDGNIHIIRLGTPLGRCPECNTNFECLVVGMQRYSIPRCDLLGDVGSRCIPYNEPENKTLEYPEITLDCPMAYRIMCPCGDGLVCLAGRCVEGKGSIDLNDLPGMPEDF